MKIGCNTVDFRTYPFEKALEWISEAGYEYVEVEANLSGLGSHRELITDEQGAKDLERPA